MKRILAEMIDEEEYRELEHELFLSRQDIETLKKNRFVTFGIHTRTHPVLMNLKDWEIDDEISGSLDYFIHNVAKAIPPFSVPFGRLYRDFDERTVIAALKSGIKYIFSAYGGHNHASQPLYNIRRISVSEDILKSGIQTLPDMIRNSGIPSCYSEKEKRLKDALERNK